MLRKTQSNCPSSQNQENNNNNNNNKNNLSNKNSNEVKLSSQNNRKSQVSFKDGNADKIEVETGITIATGSKKNNNSNETNQNTNNVNNQNKTDSYHLKLPNGYNESDMSTSDPPSCGSRNLLIPNGKRSSNDELDANFISFA